MEKKIISLIMLAKITFLSVKTVTQGQTEFEIASTN
jgi:hypothetical protein